MKWHNRDIIPQREATLILARFEEDKLKDLQIGRAQYFEGEFQIWSNDRESCHHGQILPKKFTHWAYEDEYWKLLEATEKEYSSNNYKKDMNTKHYTSIEQSKKLLELGLNPESADMHFIKTIRDTDIIYTPELLYDNPLSEIDYPCWSLAALLDIINNNDIPYRLRNNRNSKSGYILSVQLINNKGMNDFDKVTDCITWLLENNYIKSNKNE